MFKLHSSSLLFAITTCPKRWPRRMMANVLLDVAVGTIPILGDLFDVGFKANTRNVKLLEPYGDPGQGEGERWRAPATQTTDRTRRGTPWRLILPIAAVLFIALALVMIGFITVVRWLFGF